MRILVFDREIDGHHLEYLHHLYNRALTSNNEFVFLLNKKFEQVRDKFQWPVAKNIEFLFLNEKEQGECDCAGMLRGAWNASIIVRRYAKRLHVDAVWLITLMRLMPFLPFVLPTGMKISGIVYRIYLYDKVKFKGIRLLLEKIRYIILSKHRNVGEVFILNDSQIASTLNTMYRTKRFVFLPDPAPNIDSSQLTNVRNSFSIDEKTKVFLHFGALDYRKGTIEILKAINLLLPETVNNMYFIFAGKVNKEMKADFYDLLNSCRYKQRIMVFDEFCSYSFLYNLCYSCDAILIPYKNAILSSGVIGYASFFKKPVIGPNQGMLGKIIKDYSMGVLIDNITDESIKVALEEELPEVSNQYVNTHRIEDFCDVIFRGVDCA